MGGQVDVSVWYETCRINLGDGVGDVAVWKLRPITSAEGQ